MEWMREGGVGMWPVLVFGLITLGAAGHFAVRAERRSRDFAQSMVKVVAFAAATGLLTNLAAVFHYVTTHPLPGERFRETVSEGLQEALGPAIMGSAFLTVVFLFVAIGQRRLDARTTA